MAADSRGKPALGSGATTLGVRVPADIAPDDAGKIAPESGGMSVSPSLVDLPLHRIPRRLRSCPEIHGATGKDTDFVWSMGQGPFVSEAVAPRLRLRPDPRNARHGFVEPDVVMTLADYTDALGATQPQWLVDEGE